MKRFAVIGNPIDHSLSPIIHNYFGQQTGIYLNYEKIKGKDYGFEDQIIEFFNHQGSGLNVTLPYKLRAFAMADQCTERCEKAGAANTLWVKNKQLYADNTDGIGLIRDLTRWTHLNSKKILVLGAGGAVRGIIQPLIETNPTLITIANRSHEKAEELCKQFPPVQCSSLDQLSEAFDVIINGTSASLTDEAIVLPIEIMRLNPLCYDLAYKLDGSTPFTRYTQNLGCIAIDGLGMLVEQAAESFYLWNGVKPATEPVLKLLRSLN
jgi:shikimate dehydrogenase